MDRRAGDYLLDREISRGGMGIVYLAHHATRGEQVALKVTLDPCPKLAQRFAIEAATAARLRHPNLVGVVDQGTLDGRPFLAMELVDGESLDQRLKRAGALDPVEAVELILTVTEAVAYAHEEGVLHRDLKPANILVDARGRPRVTDFGLARDAQANAERLTQTGEVLGTPSYMAPEQTSGKHVDERADVYGLGATLYALLTAQPPFGGGAPLNVVKRVLIDPPLPPRQLAPAVPPWLEGVVLRCLEKDPDARYASAAELATALRAGLEQARAAGSKPRSRGPVLALAGVGLLLVGLMGWALKPEPTSPPPADAPPADVPPTDAPPTDAPPTDAPPEDGPATPPPPRATWTMLPARLDPPRSALENSAVFAHDQGRVALIGGFTRQGPLARMDLLGDEGWRGFEPQFGALHSATTAGSADRGAVFVLGGARGRTHLADLWEWRDSVWRKQVPQRGDTPPRAWALATAAYHPTRGELLVFGGIVDREVSNALWGWRPEEQRWTRYRSSGAEPAPRDYASMVYDPAGERLVLFGGHDHDGQAIAHGDTWTWKDEVWTRSDSPGPTPAPRWSAGMVHTGERVLLYGGRDAHGRAFGDLWTWDGAWLELEPEGERPSPRHRPGLVWDPTHDRAILVGGERGGKLLADTWELRLTR